MGIELNWSNLKLLEQKQSSERRSNRQRERERDSKGNRQERAEAIVRESNRQRKRESGAIVRSNRHIGSQGYMCRWGARMSHMNY